MPEQTLTKAQTDKLRTYGVKYPWSPFQTLQMIDHLEACRETYKRLVQKIPIPCARDGCTNRGRYFDAKGIWRCGIHDILDNEGKGTRS